MHLQHRSTFCSYILQRGTAIKFLRWSFNQNISIVKYKIVLGILFFLSVFSLQAQHQLSQTKPERLFQKGSEMIAHANYGAARKVFTEFLENASPADPRRSEAQYYIAFSALSLSHTDGEKLIETFLNENPASIKAATAYYDLGNFFYNEKNYAKAATYFKKTDFPALTQGQQNDGHFKWGYSLFSSKKLDEALEQFNFVKNQNSEYAPASNYYAGFIEYSKGDYVQALADLKKAELNPSYASVVPFLIANVYYRQKKYDELIQYASAAKNRKDLANAAEFSMLLAEAHYFKGDYKSAAEEYDKFLGENPARAESSLLFRAGYANYSLNQTAKALDYLSKAAAKKDSVSFYASYYLGILHIKQGEKTLATNAFDYARRVTKDKGLAEEAGFQYAKVLYDAGRAELAIGEFEKFLTTFPASPHGNEVKELLAQAYVNGNNFHKAIEYIEALPSKNAQIERAYQKATYLRGTELFNNDDHAAAVASFEKSLQYPRDPGYVALASFWAGESYSVGQRYEDAIRSYQKVLSASSADPELPLKAKYGLGYALFNLQQYDKALPHFRDFVARTNKSNPNHVDALIRSADCQYVSKQYAAALDSYNRARDIGSPDNDYILLQAGMISGIQKNYAESRNLMSSLIRSYPSSQYRDEALYHRAQFEIEQGNSQAAIDGLSQLIRESPNSKLLPYAYTLRASSNFNLKQYDKTISDYSAVLTQFPTHPVAQEALLPLQEALNIAGRSGEFENHLAQFKRTNPDNKNLEQIEFETAKNLYFDQQYDKALDKLNAFVTGYPRSARTPEAKYYIAESYYRTKDYARALQFYTQLADDNSFSMGSKVAGRIAEIEFRQGKYENAVKQYHRLERIASNKKEQYNAWTGLMESFFLLGQYDSSATYARQIIQHGAVNASAHNKASLYLGKVAYAKGDFETAKDEFLNTVNSAQDEFGAEAKYTLALIQFDQKEYKQSYETLVSLTTDFSSYEEWVGKAFLLMADYYVQMENTFQARATLQSLIDGFPLENIKTEAKRKLAEIEKAEEQKAQADTTDNND
jgi:tetratricopeptide (TPR) repeat protein/thioredoxin-like negative regulator of GroEL